MGRDSEQDRQHDTSRNPVRISPDLLLALNAANVVATIAELSDVVGATADRYEWRVCGLMAAQIRANATAILAFIRREIEANNPLANISSGTPGASCGPQCWGCRNRIGGVHLGPEATS